MELSSKVVSHTRKRVPTFNIYMYRTTKSYKSPRNKHNQEQSRKHTKKREKRERKKRENPASYCVDLTVARFSKLGLQTQERQTAASLSSLFFQCSSIGCGPTFFFRDILRTFPRTKVVLEFGFALAQTGHGARVGMAAEKEKGCSRR